MLTEEEPLLLTAAVEELKRELLLLREGVSGLDWLREPEKLSLTEAEGDC